VSTRLRGAPAVFGVRGGPEASVVVEGEPGGHVRILLVFVDGVGLGEADAGVNPLVAARLPWLARVLGGRPPVRSAAPVRGPGGVLWGVDARLGVAGVPQSGTGQAALLTGENAAALHGRHHGPWVPTALRGLVAERSVLARAVAAGRRVAFANAYPEELFAGDEGRSMARGARAVRGGAGAPGSGPGRRRFHDPLRAGPPLAALGAGVLVRHTPELARGEAVASEIVNDGWRERLGRTTLPGIGPAEAGRNLARIAAAHDLTLFAYYALDDAGHRRDHAMAVAALERLDAFLAGTLEALPADTLLVVASDHGNVEDIRTGHTLNPALFLAVGPGAEGLAAEVRSLPDLTPALLHRLT